MGRLVTGRDTMSWTQFQLAIDSPRWMPFIGVILDAVFECTGEQSNAPTSPQPFIRPVSLSREYIGRM